MVTGAETTLSAFTGSGSCKMSLLSRLSGLLGTPKLAKLINRFSLLLVTRRLQLKQLGIAAAKREQLFVGSALYDVPLIDHHDQIGAAHR